MKKIISSALFIAGFFAMASCNDSSNTEKKETDSKEVAKDQNDKKFDSTNIEGDTKFAVNIADAGMMEVKAGQLAQKNGSNAKVKEFGKMMEADHSKAGDELKTTAQKKNLSLPSVLGEDHQKKYDDLAKLKGAAFDKKYADMMVNGHKDVIDMFEKEASSGNDADLKAWASSMLPTLKHHMEMAQAMKDAVNK